jgi:hypothetical protein
MKPAISFSAMAWQRPENWLAKARRAALAGELSAREREKAAEQRRLA